MAIQTRKSFFTLPNGPSPTGNSGVRYEEDVLNGDIVSVDAGGGAINGLNRIESIYVDNTRASGTLIILFPDTGRTIFVPPAAEGCYETFTQGASFRLGTIGAKKGVHARLMLFSCRKTVFERYPGGPVIENKLDVINPAGPYLAGAYVPPPISSGWDSAYTGGIYQASGSTLTINAAGGSPHLIRWMTPQITGRLYFEIEVDTQSGADGVGFVCANDPALLDGNPSQAGSEKNDLLLRSDYYFLSGPTRYGTDNNNKGSSAWHGKTISFYVDLISALAFVYIDGHTVSPSGPGITSRSGGGIDLTGFGSPFYPCAFHFGDTSSVYKINTTGPFTFPALVNNGGASATASPWDSGQ